MSRNSSPWPYQGSLKVLDAPSDDDERSEVRRRPAARPCTSTGLYASARPCTSTVTPSPPTARGERVDGKIRTLQALLAELPPTDSRRRLIEIAVLRRDEVLLDGILQELSRHTPAAPARHRLSSHSRLRSVRGYEPPDD